MEEEENYLNTLSKGLELINKLTKNKNELSGENIFKLYDTYGFPSEIIQEIAIEKDLKLDVKEFDRLMKKQKSQSRKSSNFYIEDASFMSLTSLYFPNMSILLEKTSYEFIQLVSSIFKFFILHSYTMTSFIFLSTTTRALVISSNFFR